MPPSSHRRSLLLAAASFPFSGACTAWAGAQCDGPQAAAKLQKLEREFGGRLGLFAWNTVDGALLAHRARERFPLCSTFKLIAASAVLQRSARVPGSLAQRIRYRQSELVEYSPVTERHVAEGMSVAELCAAALQYSDNTAGNLLIKMAGGPAAVTAFARSIGDTAFRLDRWETELNTCFPGDARDTSTPEAMGRSVQRLVLGDSLARPERQRLHDWLVGNTTGAARIKASLPADWIIGDRTGAGHYGTANDVAVIWPPERAPAVVAIYTTQTEKEAKARNDVIAAAARIVVEWLG